MELVKVDSGSLVTAVFTVVASFTGLIVWVVKGSLQRQQVVTDRYFAHLEDQQRKSDELHQSTMSQLAKIGQHLECLTSEVGQLREEVKRR